MNVYSGPGTRGGTRYTNTNKRFLPPGLRKTAGKADGIRICCNADYKYEEMYKLCESAEQEMKLVRQSVK